MKKRALKIFLTLFMVLLAVGCKKKQKNNVVLQEGSYKVYYINNTRDGIIWKEYKANETEREKVIQELLDQLSKNQDDFELVNPISENMAKNDFTYNDGTMILNFDSNYESLKPIDEALVRASIVKTLTQVKGVDAIEFYINGLPLTDMNGQNIGQMTNESFIDENDVENQSTKIQYSVFFANEKGKKLVECKQFEIFTGSMSNEQIVINKLIDGPNEREKAAGLKAVISPNTVLNNVTVKEGVCYVDFSQSFLEPVEGVDEYVSLYAVVNSLIELSNINKVQIMIDGQIVEKYRDKIEINTVLERKLDLIEGIK